MLAVATVYFVSVCTGELVITNNSTSSIANDVLLHAVRSYLAVPLFLVPSFIPIRRIIDISSQLRDSNGTSMKLDHKKTSARHAPQTEGLEGYSMQLCQQRAHVLGVETLTMPAKS